MSTPTPQCKYLVLDSGPLLSLSPLRGLAETFVTVPQVLAELKDKRAQEHLQKLGLNYGVKIEVQNPDAASIATVINWAKKTGDYSVLSHPDLCVLALTHSLNEREKAKKALKTDEELKTSEIATVDADAKATGATEEVSAIEDDEAVEEETPATEPPPYQPPSSSSSSASEHEELLEPLDVELKPIESTSEEKTISAAATPGDSALPTNAPIYEDPSDEDDGEGEWITHANVGFHKSRALDLIPSATGKKGRKVEQILVGCMTADFAMQNVLLQMGLNLVSTEGKRIERVKSWVLRCHACFKICKDNSKKFCPSCGNATLLRASVTVAAANASADAPAMQVHLKPNFQYKIRGTKYSIPAPKSGTAKTGPGEGLILREDQLQYTRAKKHVDGKRERQEAKMMKGVLARSLAGDANTVAVGSWMDPDWIPELLTTGKGRTIRHGGMDGDLPAIGYGRKNPNERRKKK